MKLLTFAHRGEAQYFLEKDNYVVVEFQFARLFRNDKNFLLVTGEGLDTAEKVLSVFFPVYRSAIENVVNMGIGGALNNTLELEKIHSIKKINRENGNETFQSADVYAKIDCISAENRVNNKTYRKQLGKYAQIVDRELWACAKLANEFKKNIYSYKLISDFADEKTDQKKIKLKAKELSKKLYHFYQTLNI